MKEKKNIVLIGFMGCGKSKTSEELVSRCSRRLYSTDEMICEREKKSIPEIFEQEGEPYFRIIEKEIVAQVAKKQKAIIDCGGGVAMDPENMARLKESGMVFYLKASPECLLENIKKGEPRPLLQVEYPLARIKELLALREEYYLNADHVIDADFKRISEIVNQIEDIVEL